MPWYEKQRPALFGQAIAAAKRVFDPAGIMNPGVIVSERDIAAGRKIADSGVAAQ
jgi:alkyldihydroxyacetonephosphate synthase